MPAVPQQVVSDFSGRQGFMMQSMSQQYAILRIMAISITLASVASTVWAGVFNETTHGRSDIGVNRVSDAPRGSCGQCHVESSGPVKFPKGLWRENDNELCYTCHRNVNFSGVYPGLEVYETSNHNTDPRFAWPGPVPPPRWEPGAAGKCLNCHNPHGRKDRLGVIPSMLVAREEELCLTCHDGSPSVRDIAREIRKPYNHPAIYSLGKHRADEGGDPARYSYVGGNRHAECGDCHNAHATSGDPLPPIPPTASNRNARVGRVRAMNGGAGTIPQYEYRAAFDTSSPALEYEICFKCHSSWTQQPPGQQDMARLFNTNNASFHPVEGAGKNLFIRPEAFAGGRSAVSTIFCGDCHGSDDSNIRGPHGSQFANILRRSYEARSANRTVTRDELCFICHNFDTYLNPSAPFTGASRFNAPASPSGHTFHVGQRNIPCYACHDSHGSPRFPALIVTGRSPGIVSFSVNASGGSCLPTCHGSRPYQINYPR
jgi:predicted CXXCH cytochrome family protein